MTSGDPFWTWTHAGVILTAISGTLIPMLAAWNSDRKERARKNKDDQEQRIRMHNENQRKLDSLLLAEKYMPQHFHQEKHGPLMAEGIILPPRED